ncbi:MAG: sporulation integral membrane protein YtvI [Oscillospiraceae bacterium]|nr:sporulation integral membrane protein YtvI [Oscillospiraceae bacterium]
MDKHIKFLINAAYYGIIAIIIFLFFRYAFQYVMPFFVGFLIAYIFHQPIAILSEKSGMSKKVCSIITITLVIIVLALIIVILGVKIVDWVKYFFITFPSFYARNIEPIITEVLQWYEHFDIINELGPTIGSILEATADNILVSVGNIVSNMSVKFVSITTSLVTNLPGLLMKFLMIIISTYFISFDYDAVVGFIKNQMNAKTLDYCEHFKNHFIQTIGKYLYSYAIILFITFIELSILFTIAKVNRPVLIAFAVALFDIMPIVGTSTVMIPWMIIDIVTKNYKQAIILAIGFIIMQIVRQFTEPRVVGKRVGLNPVLALICMYVGLRRFGILGMFGIPITLVVLIEMHKAGLINLYHEPDIKSE